LFSCLSLSVCILLSLLFHNPAHSDIYTLSLHDALPIYETCSELSELPIIYTYRTSHEGGSGSKSYAEYKDLLMDVITKCDIDIVDIEFVTGGKVLSDIVDCADEHGKTVLLSHHNFKETLRLEEMQKLLYNMHSAGGEILKLAFAPNDADDVVNMLKIVKMGKEALGNKVIG